MIPSSSRRDTAFLRDGLRVGGGVSYALLEDVAPPESDYRTREFDLMIDYSIDTTATVVPHLGLEAGWRITEFGAFEETGFVYGPRGGASFFLADNVSLDFTLTYKWGTKDVFVNDFKMEDTDLSSTLGLQVMF